MLLEYLMFILISLLCAEPKTEGLFYISHICHNCSLWWFTIKVDNMPYIFYAR